MNFVAKIFPRRRVLRKKRVFSMANRCESSTELCQWVGDTIGKPIYPVEILELPLSGKMKEEVSYYLIFYQPGPPIVSEMTILHELTHILKRFVSQRRDEPDIDVERFAFELFCRIYDISEIFSPVKNSEVVERYKSLVS